MQNPWDLKDKRGHAWAGQKTVRKLYRELGIKGMKPVFKTTRGGKTPYGKFPYLLRNKFARFPNQVMATDITYIKTSWGMMYFTAEKLPPCFTKNIAVSDRKVGK